MNLIGRMRIASFIASHGGEMDQRVLVDTLVDEEGLFTKRGLEELIDKMVRESQIARRHPDGYGSTLALKNLEDAEKILIRAGDVFEDFFLAVPPLATAFTTLVYSWEGWTVITIMFLMITIGCWIKLIEDIRSTVI